MRSIVSWVLTLLLVLGSSTLCRAALWDRGGGLIYDDVFDVTWLRDANYARTSGYDDDGLMTSSEAMAWANSLVYQGYDDWRLPDAYDMDGSIPDYGWRCDSNEMGYMHFVTLGNQATLDVFDLGGLTEVGPFDNLEPFRYWSNTPYFDSTIFWWYFNFGSGLQWDAVDDAPGYAWAVREGDSTPVPVPGALLLLASGGLPAVAASIVRRSGRYGPPGATRRAAGRGCRA